MTYRLRSPYEVLPVRREFEALDLHPDDLRATLSGFGPEGVRVLVIAAVRPRYERRAGSTAEVRLLRRALAVEVGEALPHALAVASTPRQVTSKTHPPARRTLPRGAVECSLCDEPFVPPAGGRGRPRTRCDACRR